MKTCKKCGIEKPLTEFSRGKAHKDGYRSDCKSCQRIYGLEWKKKNPTYRKDYNNGILKTKPIYKEVDGVSFKLCSGCEEWKPFTDYYSGTKRSDGLSARCMKCMRLAIQDWGRRNADKVSARKKAKHPKTRKQIRKIVDWVNYKLCYKCKEWKEYSEYYANRLTVDGLQKACKSCSKVIYDPNVGGVYQQTFYKTRKIKKQLGDGFKKCSKCKEFKPKSEFYVNSQRKDGLDYACQTCRVARTIRQKISCINLNARRLGAFGKILVSEWIDVCQEYECRCIHPEHMEIMPIHKLSPDHVLPMARGGDNLIDNIQPLCWEHNQQKSVKYIDYRPLYKEGVLFAKFFIKIALQRVIHRF